MEANFMRRLKTLTAFLCLMTIFFSSTKFSYSQNNPELNNYNDSPTRLRGVIEKYTEDLGSISRFYTAFTSTNRYNRLKQLYTDNLTLLNRLNFDSLNHDEQVDYLLFKNYLDHEIKEADRNAKSFGEI